MSLLKQGQVDLTQGPIARQMIRFFIPIWCGIFFQQIYVTADAIIISKVVGESAMAAVGCTTTFINLLIGFFTGIGSGATVVIAQYFGSRENALAQRAAHTALVLAAFIGLAFMILGLLISPWLLSLLQTPPDLYDMALQYLRVYFLGMIGSVVYNMGSGILRAVGDAKRPVYILIATVIINIVLDLLFTAGLRLGVQGAAAATAISQFTAMFLVLLCMYRERELPIQFRFRRLRPDRRLLWRITLIGLPIGLQATMFDLSNLLIQSSVNFFGTSTVPAPSTGRASTSATSTAASRAYSSFIYQNPKSSITKVTKQRKLSAFSHFQKVLRKQTAISWRACCHRLGVWRRRKAVISG